MERFTDSSTVNNYAFLSRYYDELFEDNDSLYLWLKYIEMQKCSSILELASGSGNMASLLKNKGYDVVASDISPDMKEVARKNYDGEYLVLDMCNYQLDRKFDLIICICDSINYLQQSKLDDFFSCAYNHLNSGGRLIFDMHHPYRLKEFAKEYIEEGYVSDMPYQWTIASDETENVICQHFTFYDNDDMIQECHIQYVFDSETIKEKMKKMFITTVVENFVEDEKILVIGKKR